MILLHFSSTFTRLDAVISSNISPYGLIKKWCASPLTDAGSLALMCVNTRSLQPYSATSREQLDELYRTLSTHPMVKVVL